MQTGEIWIVLDSRKPGGIETHVLQLATGLAGHGVPVRVLFMAEYGDHPLHTLLQREQIAFDCLNGGQLDLYRRLKQERPYLIHTHGYKAGIVGRISARLRGIPVCSTYHAGEIAGGRVALYDLLDRLSAPLAGAVLAVSQEIARRLPVPATVLNNFIQMPPRPDRRGDRIAFVGRLSPEKGADRFLDLATAFPMEQFHIYGDGPLGGQLRRQATENVVFHGQQPSMEPTWSHIGLLVMPSRYEGLPMAALEAMGRGIPVLASRVGNLPELIENGRNGWLVDSGDHDQLTALVSQWFDLDGNRRQNLSLTVRKTIKEAFSSEAVIPCILAIYRSIRARYPVASAI